LSSDEALSSQVLIFRFEHLDLLLECPQGALQAVELGLQLLVVFVAYLVLVPLGLEFYSELMDLVLKRLFFDSPLLQDPLFLFKSIFLVGHKSEQPD